MNYLMTIILLVLVSACDSLRSPESPKASGQRAGAVLFDHSKVSKETCVACHEEDRPLGFHPKTEDCADCHTNPDWKNVKILKFTHTDAIKSCNFCHKEDRPSFPHPQNGDCMDCHTRPKFSNVDKSKLQFTHDPMPDACNMCHEEDRPDRDNHEQKADCVACHTHPSWGTQAAFTHTSDIKSCAQCHENDRKTEDHYKGVDCIKCHTNPDFSKIHWNHDPKPENCETCHTRPKLVGQRAYPNQGPPNDYDEGKNSNGSGHYYGKDCSTCHLTPKEGQSNFNFTHKDPNPGFCLPCHFNKGEDKHGIGSTTYLFKDFGNCYNCHKGFGDNGERTFDR